MSYLSTMLNNKKQDKMNYLTLQQQGEIKLFQEYVLLKDGEIMNYEDASCYVDYAYASSRAGIFLDNAIKYVAAQNPDFYDNIADNYNL
jgi:hypothetical protein